MKKIVAVSFALLVSAALPALAAPPAPQPQGLPQPKILIIDQNMVLQGSKVGQDIGRQVQALTSQARNDLQAQGKALQAEGNALQQQIAILSADAKASKVKAFEAKQAALQAQAAKKEGLIQGGLYQARQAIAQALGPILKQLLDQRGANMILEKNAVLMATDGRFDITPQAIDLLNQKMPTYKVQLVALPPGMQAPGQ